ncbi:STAS domain-containing protein [Haloactinomyces albus]|uniref:Anti-sigma factor antagonist n=1 Tax=Haloactinomyces albus TaxID=1352928 RepID=A0AAE4CJY9_9ACTN|nr:STAS domain-containing protein [Haloactinomyces albus]MDR7300610.1 anti-anti-sigma factor [Haloactinomyces albus]
MTSFDSSVHTETTEPAEGQIVIAAVEWYGREAVLPVSGDVDMVTAPTFEEALTSALEGRPEKLVVDLTGVDFFASAGLSALVTAYQQAEGHTALCVVAPNTATARPLQVTALDRRIPVHASRQEALSES